MYLSIISVALRPLVLATDAFKIKNRELYSMYLLLQLNIVKTFKKEVDAFKTY